MSHGGRNAADEWRANEVLANRGDDPGDNGTLDCNGKADVVFVISPSGGNRTVNGPDPALNAVGTRIIVVNGDPTEGDVILQDNGATETVGAAIGSAEGVIAYLADYHTTTGGPDWMGRHFS